jgi:hypothetical protein
MLAIKDQTTQTLRKLRSEYRIYINGSAKVLNTLKDAKAIASRVKELELAYGALEAVEKELSKRGELVPRAYNPKRRAPKRRTHNGLFDNPFEGLTIETNTNTYGPLGIYSNRYTGNNPVYAGPDAGGGYVTAEASLRPYQRQQELAQQAAIADAYRFAAGNAQAQRQGQASRQSVAASAQPRSAAYGAPARVGKVGSPIMQRAPMNLPAVGRVKNPSLADAGDYIRSHRPFKASALSGAAKDIGSGRLHDRAREDFYGAVREAQAQGPLRDTFYAVYSYSTPIAWWVRGYGWTIVGKAAVMGSVTTSKHLTVVKRAIGDARVVNPAVRGHHDYDDDRSVSAMRVRPLKADRQEKIVRELLADKAHRKAKSHKPKRGHR